MQASEKNYRIHQIKGLNIIQYAVTLRDDRIALVISNFRVIIGHEDYRVYQYLASENCGLMLTLKCCRFLCHKTTDAINSKPCGQTFGA